MKYKGNPLRSSSPQAAASCGDAAEAAAAALEHAFGMAQWCKALNTKREGAFYLYHFLELGCSYVKDLCILVVLLELEYEFGMAQWCAALNTNRGGAFYV